MAKRSTGVGSKTNKKTSPHKTKKRLEIKSQMLKDKAEKHKRRK